MTDLLSIGASGIRAYQNALNVVGDNVANANTPGYVRRSIILATGPGVGAGEPLARTVSAGSGVITQSIGRAYDGLKATAARNAQGDVARLTTRSEWLTQLQSALGSGEASLTVRIAGFFDAATDLASAPASVTARTLFLDKADQAATQFRTTADALDNLRANLDSATTAATTEVNQITAGLDAINVQLRRSQSAGSAANGLLDSRDTLLGRLSTLVRVSVTETVGGAVDIRLGDSAAGASLLSIAGATRIGVANSPGGPVVVLDPTHNPVTVRLPASGALSGLLDATRKTIDAHTAIDNLAAQFAQGVNAQHLEGVDAQGLDGTPLFATRTLTIAAGGANGGHAGLDISIADLGVVDPSGYQMTFLGGQWTLSRGDASLATSGSGPLMLDGITVTPSGTAQEGDSYRLAAADGAAGLSLRPISPANIAASARWLTDANPANSGSGVAHARVNLASIALPPLAEYRIDIAVAGSADIYDPASGTLLATVPLGIASAGSGFDFNISGTANVGDSFRITRALAGGSDNGNLRAVLNLRNAVGATGTLEAGLDATVAGVASSLAETRRLGEAAVAVAADAARTADSVSGVDLDREAAELVQLQTAYRAASQIIAAARDLFETLLQAAN